MRALKMRSTVTSCWKLTMTNWENHQSWSSYNYIWSCPRTQCQSFCCPLAFEINCKGEKAWWVSASLADHKSKNINILKCHLLYSVQRWTISQLDCDMWWKVDNNGQWPTWTKKLKSTFQSQTCTKKCHGHCLVVCYQYDPIQLSESQ